MSNSIKYSIVVPVYNSEDSLHLLLKKISEVFTKINENFEVVFINDYSIDNSWQILKNIKLENQNINITLINLAENFGQQKATLCGLENSNGRFIITIDDDLQILPEEIIKLISHQETEDYDIIYGFFNYNKKFIRTIGSNIVNNIKKNKQKKTKYSSFRLIKKETIEKIHFSKHKTNILIDEMLYWTTANISYVEVEHKERMYNSSNYTTKKLFGTAINTLVFSSTIPLKLIIYAGFSLSIFSFILGLYFIYRKFIHHVPLGYTSIIVTILFSTSVLLLSLGIIGKYIKELYIQQYEKPPYLIKKIIK